MSVLPLENRKADVFTTSSSVLVVRFIFIYSVNLIWTKICFAKETREEIVLNKNTNDKEKMVKRKKERKSKYLQTVFKPPVHLKDTWVTFI